MFRGLWRAIRGEPRELAILELAFVGLLYAIPLLFAPIIPFADARAHKPAQDDAIKEYQPTTEGVLAWSARGIGSLIDAYRDDLVAVFTIVLAWSTIGLWMQTKRLDRKSVV